MTSESKSRMTRLSLMLVCRQKLMADLGIPSSPWRFYYVSVLVALFRVQRRSGADATSLMVGIPILRTSPENFQGQVQFLPQLRIRRNIERNHVTAAGTAWLWATRVGLWSQTRLRSYFNLSSHSFPLLTASHFPIRSSILRWLQQTCFEFDRS